MNKQTKSNLRTSLQSLGIVFLIFFVMAFACDDDTQTGKSNLPMIAGTVWKIDPKIKDASPQTYFFCKTGRWEVMSSRFLGHQDIPGHKTGGAVTFGGTYTIKGNTLVSKEGDNGAITNYTMSWNGSRLMLDDGQAVLELYEPQANDCE